MSPRKAKPATSEADTIALHLKMPADQVAALRQIQVEDGVPVVQSVRRAVALWLSQRDNGKGRR